VRGSKYLHAGLRFSLEFPTGWNVVNSASQVVAKEPDVNALLLLEPLQRPIGRTLGEVAFRSMEGAGFRPLDGAPATINGLSAFVGTYEGSLRDVGRVTVRGAHIQYERTVFLVAGIAPEQSYPRVAASIARTLESFKPLTRGEADAIRPNRLQFYTARNG